MNTDLTKFIEAQENTFEVDLSEIKSGRKRSHWMWFIFPQLAGLGFSETFQFYSIKSLNEAKEYFKHPVLGERLNQITAELLKLDQSDPERIFGSPDHLKHKSSMTLFAMAIDKEENIFKAVLRKFFDCQLDTKTLELLKNEF